MGVAVSLTKRVQVLFSPEEYRRLKDISRKRKKPVGELIRSAVRESYEQNKADLREEAFKKLCSIKLELPDWEELEEEIVKGKIAE